MKDYQVMPDLSDEEYEKLKADIAERGVMVPIEMDQHGNILDGHHRLKACKELGIDNYPTAVRVLENEIEKLRHAWQLNTGRRNLTAEQRNEAIVKLKIDHPELSVRHIAYITGVDDHTVAKALEFAGAEIPHVQNIQGMDGKTYPIDPQEQREAIREMITENPDMNNHQIAQAIGASDHTVAKQRDVVNKVVSVFNPSKRDADALRDPDIQRRLAENDGMNVAGAIREQRRERLASKPNPDEGIKVTVTPIDDNGFRFEREGGIGGEIYNMDCLDVMANMPDESVDLIIADPPYFEVWGEFDFKWNSEAEYLDWIFKCLVEFERILKPSGTLMLWGALGKGRLTLCKVALWIEENNLFALQNWITQRNTRGNGAEKNYMSCREEVLFFTKTDSYTFNIPYTDEVSDRIDLGANGKPRENDYKRASNVWCDIAEASQSSIERCFHPTVKALGLCDRIIQTHSNKNDIVYIPFTGSGSEVVSCIKNNRQFFGTEIDGEYFTQSIDRIKDLLRGGAA